uniref:Uncharacterized protein n=1 Tax=Clastoptera arizonana TaxID=38151 RepID=A0A1B6DWF3_9HEMI
MKNQNFKVSIVPIKRRKRNIDYKIKESTNKNDTHIHPQINYYNCIVNYFCTCMQNGVPSTSIHSRNNNSRLQHMGNYHPSIWHNCCNNKNFNRHCDCKLSLERDIIDSTGEIRKGKVNRLEVQSNGNVDLTKLYQFCKTQLKKSKEQVDIIDIMNHCKGKLERDREEDKQSSREESGVKSKLEAKEYAPLTYKTQKDDDFKVTMFERKTKKPSLDDYSDSSSGLDADSSVGQKLRNYLESIKKKKGQSNDKVGKSGKKGYSFDEKKGEKPLSRKFYEGIRNRFSEENIGREIMFKNRLQKEFQNTYWEKEDDKLNRRLGRYEDRSEKINSYEVIVDKKNK